MPEDLSAPHAPHPPTAPPAGPRTGPASTPASGAGPGAGPGADHGADHGTEGAPAGGAAAGSRGPLPRHGRRAPDGLPATPAGRPRIYALDVLRGFALCGILLANVRPIANIGGEIIPPGPPPGLGDASAWLGLLVEQRFFPIFATLFGVGFSLLLDAAAARTARPRLVLLRRLLVLLAVGLAHMLLLWRGDVLTVYAVCGLLVLLPSTWLPRWAVAALAPVLTVTALIVSPGGYNMTPGLFLLGSALVRYGVIDRLGRSARGPLLLGTILAVAAAPVLWAQTLPHAADDAVVTGARLGALAGLLVAGVYACALPALLATPLRRALRAVFEPLGRMALTNYLTATVVVVALAHLDGSPGDWAQATVFGIAGAVLAVQWAWSALWLRRFRYGPLEWLWRWATWLRRPARR